MNKLCLNRKGLFGIVALLALAVCVALVPFGIARADDVSNNDNQQSNADVTLYYNYDNSSATLTISDNNPGTWTQTTDMSRGWNKNDIKNNCKHVKFTGQVKPGLTDSWFNGFVELLDVDLNHLDVSNTATLTNMFYGCSKLNNINTNVLNTSNVTSISGMFNGCSSLSSLELSSFNTSNVTNMTAVFWDCSSLSSLDLSSFNTSNVNVMLGMFWGCSSLKSLDLSSFDTSTVENMFGMFNGCTQLENLNLSSFNTAAVFNMGSMFKDCNALVTLDISSFDSYGLVTAVGSSLTETMFQNCTDLTTIIASDKFDISSLLDNPNFYGKDMFKGCTSLVGANGFKYDPSVYDNTSNVYNDAIYAKIDGGSANPGYFSPVPEPVPPQPEPTPEPTPGENVEPVTSGATGDATPWEVALACAGLAACAVVVAGKKYLKAER